MLRHIPGRAEARPSVLVAAVADRGSRYPFQFRVRTFTFRDPELAVGNIGFQACAPNGLLACCASFEKQAGMPVWRTDRNVYVPRHAGIGGGGVFQAAMECR